MNNVMSNAKFWITGVVVALAGVALARVVGPGLAGTTRIVVVVAGQFLALAGLFIICLGVRRRIKQTADQGGGRAA